MKKIIFSAMLFFTCLNIFAQIKTSKNYKVDFTFISKTENVNQEDSIKLVSIDKNGDTSISKIKNNSDNMANHLIEYAYYVKGNAEKSEIVFSKTTNVQGRVPEKIIYTNNNWFSGKAGSLKKIPFKPVLFKLKDNFKQILGYNCQKAIGIMPDGIDIVTVWVCEKLPATIMPGAGFKPLKGAVLEMGFSKQSSHFMATKITLL